MEISTAQGQQVIAKAERRQNASPGRAGLVAVFVICYISIMFSGISSMLMSVYLPVIVKDLLGPVTDARANNVGAYLNSVFLFGSMFGGFAWGFICDRIGRSKAVALSTAMYGLFTLLTAFCNAWVLAGAYRFITGFGVGGVMLTTNVLVAEIWPGNKKAVVLGIVSAAMPVGFIFTGAMNNLLADWHSAFLTGVVPVVIAVIGYFMLPESGSWKSGRSGNDAGVTRGRLFDRAYRRNLVAGSVIFGAMLIGLWAVFSWAPTWVQSINGNDDASRDLRGLTMMVLAISGLVGSIISGWIVNAIGLPKTMMVCFAACFVMTFIVFKLNTAISAATFVEMGVLAFFFGISQGALSVFIPALFPTVVRASATGFCFNIGRLFTATAIFFIGSLVAFLGGYGNAVFIFSFVFLIGLAWTYVSYKKGIYSGADQLYV